MNLSQHVWNILALLGKKHYGGHFHRYHMNRDEDISAFVQGVSKLIDTYRLSLDSNHLLSVLIMLCKAIGEANGERPKDFRRRLKEIIEMRTEDC